MNTKKAIFRLIVTLGLLSLLALPVSPAIAANTVSIGLAATDVPEGGDFIATIDLDSIANFDAAQYDITYDPAVIEVTDVTAGLIGTDTIPVSWGYIPTGVQGTIRVINNVPNTPGVTGSGYLAEIHFHVVGSTGASSAISLSHVILGDNLAQEIAATWTNGSVDIIATVTADFSADKTEVLVDETVTFTANPAGGSGTYTYEWDFGDTGTSTEANPTHTYTSPNTYTVSLTVYDTSDGSDTETKTDYITVYADLVAGASADIDEAVVGETVTFSSSTTTGGKAGYTYAWDFGDTNTSAEANPTHSYTASDNKTVYTVTLTVTDSLNNTDTATVTVTVYERGNADGDQSIDIYDLTYVELIIMENPGYDQTAWADANEDGSWNALDLTAIELIILGP